MYIKFFKRIIDLVLSFLGILVLLLPMAVIAAVIKAGSPGPVLFKQKRVGIHKTHFDLLKFRTMRTDTPHDIPTHMLAEPEQYITGIGRFLRKTSLDEFPQFFNVFRGDMSLVGPRPHMLKHTEEYSKLIDKYMVRHFIKPGITGWAQINGYRGETKTLQQMEKRVEYDVWYLEHWNIFLDLKILILTFWGIFKGDENAF